MHLASTRHLLTLSDKHTLIINIVFFISMFIFGLLYHVCVRIKIVLIIITRHIPAAALLVFSSYSALVCAVLHCYRPTTMILVHVNAVLAAKKFRSVLAKCIARRLWFSSRLSYVLYCHEHNICPWGLALLNSLSLLLSSITITHQVA